MSRPGHAAVAQVERGQRPDVRPGVGREPGRQLGAVYVLVAQVAYGRRRVVRRCRPAARSLEPRR